MWACRTRGLRRVSCGQVFYLLTPLRFCIKKFWNYVFSKLEGILGFLYFFFYKKLSIYNEATNSICQATMV